MSFKTLDLTSGMDLSSILGAICIDAILVDCVGAAERVVYGFLGAADPEAY